MRTTTLAITYIVAMAFPSFAALGQDPIGNSPIATASGAFSPNPATWRSHAHITATFDATVRSGIGNSRRRAPAETYDNHFTKRLGLGLLGFATGAFIGYQSGAMIRSCDRCYFRASTEMITGTIAGALIGTSLLAMPSLGSACTSATRIRRALTGAGIGYVVGLLLTGPLLPYPIPFAGPGVALSTALGGLVAQGRCL